MKLLIITAVTALDKDIKKMPKQVDVQTFTYKEVTGFKDISKEAIESNWFASDISLNESMLYYAFVKTENVDPFFALVNECNNVQNTASNIHRAVFNTEKYN
jgi:hypothetical protein